MNEIDKIRRQIFQGLQSAYCQMDSGTFTEFCKEISDTMKNYPKQKLNIAHILQAEGSDGVQGAAVGKERGEKGVSAEDCNHEPVKDSLGFYYCSICRTLL